MLLLRPLTSALLAVLAATAACSGPRAGTTPAHPVSPAALRAPALRALGSDQGATVVLAGVGERTMAFVADEDARAIIAVDLDTRAELARTPAGGVPSQLLVLPDGRLVVLLRDASELRVLTLADDRGALEVRSKIATPAEPVALALTPDRSTLVVAAGWGRALVALDAKSLTERFRVALPREPRSVVVSDDGAVAFVSHAVGSVVSEVDLRRGTRRVIAIHGNSESNLATGRAAERAAALDRDNGKPPAEEAVADTAGSSDGVPRVGCQGFALAKSISPAGRILAPQVLVDPGSANERSEGYGSANGVGVSEVAAVIVIDEATGVPLLPSLAGVAVDSAELRQNAPCLLPRAATVDPRSRALLVACFGIDSVVAYDAASATPAGAERQRWAVGAGPTGIAVDPDKPRAVVWSQFDRTVTWIDPTEPPLAGDRPSPTASRLSLAPVEGLSTSMVLGRYLFHTTDDARVSQDGRACASCHPDGRDDAITWATPDGPRRSIMLAGRVLATAPYAWSGSAPTLAGHISHTFERLKGSGLKSMELEALMAYIAAMPAPPRVDGAADSRASRGAAIFGSAQAGCAACHSGAAFTDGKMHDVRSKTDADRDGRFNTPTLRFVAGTGPYFHDGRYQTLREVLRGSDGAMGHTGHLQDEDLDALEAYVRTL